MSTIIYIVAIVRRPATRCWGSRDHPRRGVRLRRRITGGVLAPMLTHFFWGLVMVLALPPIFGV